MTHHVGFLGIHTYAQIYSQETPRDARVRPQRTVGALQEAAGSSTSHSWQALPSFSADLAGEPRRSRRAWLARSSILPWRPWSPWSCRHLHGELNPGGVVRHPLYKKEQGQVIGHPGTRNDRRCRRQAVSRESKAAFLQRDVRARNVALL